MSLNVINSFLSEEDIDYILNLQEVINAKKSIDSKTSGSVYFSVNLTSSIKKTIFDNFGLSLETVPMRWIKGDTMPHIDISSKQFEKTHLVYLTDSPGEFLLENNSYPITKNSAFVFNEGLCHETINTGLEPRLLLGPMSEEGLSVGLDSISGPGGTSVYIRDIGSGIEYMYSYDPVPNNWQTLPTPTCSVINTDSNSGMFIVEFTTDINITMYNQYLICGSTNIQFGLKTLKGDGTRHKIYIDGASMGGTPYSGFIKNHDGSVGYNSIHIFNLEVRSINGSTLEAGAGWLCHSNFGKTATDNYIINCYSDGEIAGQYSGGIVGSNAASNGGNLTIIGCSSSGVISGEQSGGIVGYNSGVNGGTVAIQSCWSTGLISATVDPNSGGCGGIVGSNSQFTTVTNCYSTGVIAGNNAGGIVGANPGNTGVSALPIVIENCYSFGNITGANSGGICGSLNSNNNVQITNCYSLGDVVSNGGSGILAGAICGINYGSVLITNCYAVGTVTETIGYIIAGSTDISLSSANVNILDCYSEAGSLGGTPGAWIDIHANATLTNNPSGGYPSTWTTNGQNIPYDLFNMGYTPYSITNINLGLPSKEIRTQSYTVNPGNSTNSAIKTTGIYYAFLEDYSSLSISINNATGAITAGSLTPLATYTLYIYDDSNGYNITTYTLTVTSAPEPTPTPTPTSSDFPIQHVSLNQKSSFCGTRAVSSTAVGIGAIRGKGSATRIFNNCKGNNSVNFKLCQYRVLGYK